MNYEPQNESEQVARDIGKTLGQLLAVHPDPNLLMQVALGVNEAQPASNQNRRNLQHAGVDYEAAVNEPLRGDLHIEVNYDVDYGPVPWVRHRNEVVDDS